MRFLLLFIALLSPCVFAQEDTITVKQQQIQQILNHWRVTQHIPSATLSLFLPYHNSPITFNSGTTIYGGSIGTNNDTLYQAGSITKSFTSTVILKLEAEGKLNIDDPITAYLPQYPLWSNITIRQLLNHTSGIFNYTEAGRFNQIRKADPRVQFTPEALVRIASEHRCYFPPGKGWKYSNTNYVLAGMIIEKVTGKSMADVMHYYLHGGGLGLNLSNTFFVPGLYSNILISHMAHGYSVNGTDATYDNMSWAYTVGAIVSNTEDLLTWWRALFQGKILPSQQMEQMLSLVCESTTHCVRGEPIAHIPENGGGKGYGLGVIQTGYGSDRIGTVWWHNGSTRGYKALVMWFPKSDIYMALTISRDPGYLLKPDLPIIRNVLNVLIPNVEWHQAHPRPQHHYFTTHTKKSAHHFHTASSKHHQA